MSNQPRNDFIVFTPFITYGLSILLVFVPFLVFVFSGWGGEPNSCLTNDAGNVDLNLRDNCFCERVDIDKVINGEPGVRQPANTWSNLYALVTAMIVAIGMFRDRRKKSSTAARNLITSDNLLADIFVFAVFFLGFGSMWYHASITEWGGRFDGMSMYAFVGYMISYTLYRLVPLWWLFLVVYVVVVGIFTALHNAVPSTVLIAINVGIYVVLEIIVLIFLCKNGNRTVPGGWYMPLIWWLCAIASFGLAFMFWKFGVAGESTCDPTSAWQWHGMWHWPCLFTITGEGFQRLSTQTKQAANI